jgi:glyoxylase-like metal-dependent hydrolase (beta-lactamase superfamily II)
MRHDSNRTTRRHFLGGSAALTATAILAPEMVSLARATAPFLGPAQPTYSRFKLGAFEITTILDSDVSIDGPWPLIGANAEEEEVQALMRKHLLPEEKYQPGFTPMIVNTGKEMILFDTGNGENGFVSRPQGGWLAAQLEPAGFSPDQIDVVVLSHGHSDHIGGLVESGKLLFPNARYVIGDVEYDFWSKQPGGDLKRFSKLFQELVVPLADKTTFVKPGSEVAPGIRAVDAYGHTPGHLAFHIESDSKQLLFWGDCAHHHVASLARPDWHCVFDVDKEQGAAARKRMFDMVATDKLPVAAFHMPFPSIGYVEEIEAGSYRWVPHTYQLTIDAE